MVDTWHIDVLDIQYFCKDSINSWSYIPPVLYVRGGWLLQSLNLSLYPWSPPFIAPCSISAGGDRVHSFYVQNAFHSSGNTSMKLRQSKLHKSSGYPPQSQSYEYTNSVFVAPQTRKKFHVKRNWLWKKHTWYYSVFWSLVLATAELQLNHLQMRTVDVCLLSLVLEGITTVPVTHNKWAVY